jgi:hypothetical protein
MIRFRFFSYTLFVRYVFLTQEPGVAFQYLRAATPVNFFLNECVGNTRVSIENCRYLSSTQQITCHGGRKVEPRSASNAALARIAPTASNTTI